MAAPMFALVLLLYLPRRSITERVFRKSLGSRWGQGEGVYCFRGGLLITRTVLCGLLLMSVRPDVVFQSYLYGKRALRDALEFLKVA